MLLFPLSNDTHVLNRLSAGPCPVSAESRILGRWMPHASNLGDERCRRRGRRNPNARRKVIIKFTASFGFAATGLEGERGRGERIVFR